MPRDPQDTVATLDDFRNSGWRAAVSESRRTGHFAFSDGLAKAAQEAMDHGKAANAKVLWLLSDSCSMMLKPKSVNEPFAPLAVFDGKRSALSDDFSQDDISLLADIASELDDDWVKSRIADIVWLCKKPKSVSHAHMAIDAYRSMPLDGETWAHGAMDCWERAIALSLQLRGGAGPRLSEIESVLLAKFHSEASDKGFFRLSLSRVLLENKLAGRHAQTIADALAEHGSFLVANNAHYEARSYLEAAALWYDRRNKTRKADMTCAVAETWAGEAAARASAAQPSHMLAAGFYEKAIQVLRSVPREFRADRNVDSKIAELHLHMDDSGKASLGEMGAISSGQMDITEIVRAAQAWVRGKSILEALAALANIHGGAQKKKLTTSAEQMLQSYPLQALFSTTQMSRDGRVVAKQPAMEFGSSDSADYQLALWARMVKDYTMDIGLVVLGQILPALQAFTLDHRIREADLVQIASHSPIVPEGRAALVGKALFAGFEQDWVTAIHLVVPQVEHLVRSHLKLAGGKTSTLSLDGIENENGLSTLIDLPEVEVIFGEDLAFELNALFCDAFGPNLRNELAHGLLDDADCQSKQTVYAWWLLLRITFNTFYAARRKGQDSPPPDEAPGESDAVE